MSVIDGINLADTHRSLTPKFEIDCLNPSRSGNPLGFEGPPSTCVKLRLLDHPQQVGTSRHHHRVLHELRR